MLRSLIHPVLLRSVIHPPRPILLSGSPELGRGGQLNRPLFLLLFLLGFTSPAHAQARPQVLTIIADHLTLADTLRPDTPAFARLHARGQTALMSPGLAHGPAPVPAVYATLGAGDSIALGSKSQGLLSRTLAPAHKKCALVGTADSDETGPYQPAALLLPTAPDSAPNDGTLFDPTSPGGRRTDPARLWSLTQAALSVNDFVVTYDGEFARAERSKDTLLPTVYAQDRVRALHSLDTLLAHALSYADTHPQCTLLLIVPTGPLHGQTWDSLTPCFIYAHASPTSPVLQSDTTQTWGLVAARDFAPTVLARLRVSVPIQMTGAPMESAAFVPVTKALPRLRRLDTLTRLNQDAQNPFFWTVGVLSGLTLLAGLALAFADTAARRPALHQAARAAMRALSALPLALLLAPLTGPQSLPALYVSIALGLALLALLLPSPGVILSATALVLIGDGLTGTTLVSQSLLSVYALSGIRFYGIGNEYMGVLLAGTLTLAGASFFVPPRHGALALLFAVVIIVLSFPSFGAKAGGAVTATATFWVAWRALSNKSVGARHVLIGIIAGFAVVLLWGILGHWLPMRQTHIGTATAALGHARFGYIVGVALRKVGLAVRVALHPGTLAGLLGLGLAAGLARQINPARLAAFYARSPRFPALWRAGLWGALVCVLFNDSGIVAAILLLTSLALVGLDGLLALPREAP